MTNHGYKKTVQMKILEIDETDERARNSARKREIMVYILFHCESIYLYKLVITFPAVMSKD